jgi:hypothetical protein
MGGGDAEAAVAIIQALVAAGGSGALNASDRGRGNVLHAAAQRADEPPCVLMRRLLGMLGEARAGEMCRQANAQGRTPLMLACEVRTDTRTLKHTCPALSPMLPSSAGRCL